MNTTVSKAQTIYGKKKETNISTLDKNRYNLHKKPSGKVRKCIDDRQPEPRNSKIRLTRNVKKDLNGYLLRKFLLMDD